MEPGSSLVVLLCCFPLGDGTRAPHCLASERKGEFFPLQTGLVGGDVAWCSERAQLRIYPTADTPANRSAPRWQSGTRRARPSPGGLHHAVAGKTLFFPGIGFNKAWLCSWAAQLHTGHTALRPWGLRGIQKRGDRTGFLLNSGRGRKVESGISSTNMIFILFFFFLSCPVGFLHSYCVFHFKKGFDGYRVLHCSSLPANSRASALPALLS